MKKRLRELFAGRFKSFRIGEGLARKVASGSIWLGAGSGTEQVLRLVRNMIVARLLAPEAFGVMAIIFALSSALESLTDIGIKTAVIQNSRGHEPSYLNGAWWLSAVRSLMLYIIGFAGAPWISGFYGLPELTPLIRVAFLSIFFNGVTSAGLYVAYKNMLFKKWVGVNLGGSILGILVGITLAFVLENVWALVVGYTIESAGKFILSFLLCPYIPRLEFDRQHLYALMKFASGVFGLPILTNIFMQADIFVIGKLCTPSELGLYSIAASLSRMVFQTVGNLVGQIAMPVFSEMQNDRERIAGIIILITSALSFLGFPFMLFAALYGKDLLYLLYGPQYEGAALPFAILIATAFLQIINVPVVTYYFSIGRPEMHRLVTIVRMVLMVAIIYPFVKYFGLVGGACASMIAMLAGHLMQLRQMSRTTRFDLAGYANLFWKPAAVSVLVGGVWIATYGVFNTMPLMNFFLGGLGCVLSYTLATVIFLKKNA